MSKGENTAGCLAVLLWGLFTLAWFGVIVWAIIELVNWITTK